MRRRRLQFILAIQLILLLAHAVVFETWAWFWESPDPGGVSKAAIAFALLSVSFVGASLLAFRYYNVVVRVLYTAAAAWLGVLNFCFFAALGCWIVEMGARMAGFPLPPRKLAAAMFGAAIVAALCGIANSFWLRVRRLNLRLPHLPRSWHGRVAALVSDTHLGPVRGVGFSRRIVSLLNRHKPDVVFLTGDFYDGTAADVDRFAEPLAKLAAPLGAYFVTGNHEEFRDPRPYVDALSRAGVRVLENEKVDLDGLQLVGISYREMATSDGFAAALRGTGLNSLTASILLIHAPNRLWEAEQAGVSLQLSGHTHKGQCFPWTHLVARIYGKFAYGFHRLGNLQVYTTSGAGTWGPPARLGSSPEIVLFRFI